MSKLCRNKSRGLHINFEKEMQMQREKVSLSMVKEQQPSERCMYIKEGISFFIKKVTSPDKTHV